MSSYYTFMAIFFEDDIFPSFQDLLIFFELEVRGTPQDIFLFQISILIEGVRSITCRRQLSAIVQLQLLGSSRSHNAEPYTLLWALMLRLISCCGSQCCHIAETTILWATVSRCGPLLLTTILCYWAVSGLGTTVLQLVPQCGLQ
jgi:hypothetical protein